MAGLHQIIFSFKNFNKFEIWLLLKKEKSWLTFYAIIFVEVPSKLFFYFACNLYAQTESPFLGLQLLGSALPPFKDMTLWPV